MTKTKFVTVLQSAGQGQKKTAKFGSRILYRWLKRLRSYKLGKGPQIPSTAVKTKVYFLKFVLKF